VGRVFGEDGGVDDDQAFSQELSKSRNPQTNKNGVVYFVIVTWLKT